MTVATHLPTRARAQLWSEHAGKRAAQRFYLAYTPVWGALAGAVMLSGRAGQLGDAPLMAVGVVLALGQLAGGYYFAPPEERARPFWSRYHTKLMAFMALFAALGNYFGTRYFYEVLGMHYGFRTAWNWNHVPVFLYLLTLVYFTTYSALMDVALRAWGSLRGDAPGTVHPVVLLPVSLALAGLETALNANPFMRDAYCYDNLALGLGFGTLIYGTWFVIIGPVWYRIDERPGDDTPITKALSGALAAFMLILCANEAYKHVVAPRVTTVVEGRVGMPGLQGPSCIDAAGR